MSVLRFLLGLIYRGGKLAVPAVFLEEISTS